MSRLINPDEQFFDNDTGAPLALGTLYFGEPNQDPETNPKAVYSDAALTTAISATQPLTADGKPQQFIYLKGDYSLTVRDSGGAVVFTADTVSGSAADIALVTATISTMKGLNAVPGQVITLTQTGRAGQFVVKSGTPPSDPQEGIYVVLANGNYAERVWEGAINAYWFGLPSADTADTLTKISAIESFVFSNQWNAYFPAGTYDVGNNNFPFRNTVNTALKDYGGVVIYGDGTETVFQTTSNDGADVLQLNAVQNIRFKDIKVTAVLTDTIGAGSNGISLTNGGKNIELDVVCENLPYVDATSYLDGGKALTIQPGTSTNGLENIKANIVARNVGYGFGMDINNDALINAPIKGVDVKIFCDGAYRGVSLSGTANSSTVPSSGLEWGVRVRGTTVNCQKHYISDRAWGADVALSVMNTQSTFPSYLASDTERLVTSVLGSKNETLEVSGLVETVDVLHRMGGTTNGGGVVGSSNGMVVNLNVDFQIATTQFDLVDSGGNTVAETVLGINNVSSFPTSDFLSNQNVLTRAGVLQARNFRNYNTFEHYSSAGAKTFGLRPDGNIESTLTSASALGAYVGKKAEYDETGAFLGYRPIYG